MNKLAGSVARFSRFSRAVVRPSFSQRLYSVRAFAALDTFERRHIGPRDSDISEMLKPLNKSSLDELTASIVPKNIQLNKALELEKPLSESEALEELKEIIESNQLNRSFIGTGYYGTKLPSVILRNVLENPGWYTPYTPYQAEISQGRLESLLNYQTMVCDLTKMDISNASLLDEATAAAEAMFLCFQTSKKNKHTFLIEDTCHPQTIALIKTRAAPLGVNVVVAPASKFTINEDVFGAIFQYPNTFGSLEDYTSSVKQLHANGALAICATDLLALTVITPPGELGFDIAVGSAQRFGVPMGYGGPHAGFMAVLDSHKRLMPGRIIGVSQDRHGNRAYRMSLQTREQHIRRDKATSNICTAQALLSNIAAMYAVYHGPSGLKDIANSVHAKAVVIAEGLRELGFKVRDGVFFDTIRVETGANTQKIVQRGYDSAINVRNINNVAIGISVDETTTEDDVNDLFEVFSGKDTLQASQVANRVSEKQLSLGAFARKSEFLTHPVFNTYHSEHQMLRYMHSLEAKDLGLNVSMIPLGSCTMKLNATSEMIPVTWAKVGGLHPFAPVDQATGYQHMIKNLEQWLSHVTGFDATTLQPNSGSQGEYAGLLAIREFHLSRGEGHRNLCLIPTSAHGTNPASAMMAGMEIVTVKCDAKGNVDVEDLRAKAEQHRSNLSCLMITYPSTHGVFEVGIREICDIVHANGGQVYMDGANMNAQVGLCRPGDFGPDVCHLNLHKTFCIPHGGGGPGVGPICVKKHLAPFLPGSPLVSTGGEKSMGSISAAPWGSASILPITWMYIRMMGGAGLKKATQVAILNANYMASRLSKHYPVLFTGEGGFVAHEFIMDIRPITDKCGVSAEDIAKRLMDYGFHAPTMSFPVAGTLMIEPTESEDKGELDRLCDALISIRHEIEQVENGTWPKDNNPLVHAPHTQLDVTRDDWNRPYSRHQAAFPASWSKANKFWPTVGRIDNVWGDRNLFCTCPPMDSFK